LIYGIIFVAIGGYVSSSRFVESSLVISFVIWMMEDNGFNVIFKGLFWVCASAVVMRGGVWYFGRRELLIGGLLVV
jgi:hypothetical protein